MADATVLTFPQIDEATNAREEFLNRYTGCTRTAYRVDLAAWYSWCAQAGVPVLDVTRAHVEAYARWMLDTKHYAPRTRERRISTVCGFYKLCLEDQRITSDPTRFVKRPKVPKESPTLGLSYLEFARFLDSATELSPNDDALAALIGLLGLRCTEALSVDIDDFTEERGHRVVRVVGKGGDITLIPLPIPVARSIARAAAGRTTGPLLRTRTGARYTRSSVRRAVARICKKAGITKRISPHSLRHTYITQMLDGNVSLRDAQIAARHADPRMTMRYDRARHQLDRHANYVLAARMAN